MSNENGKEKPGQGSPKVNCLKCREYRNNECFGSGQSTTCEFFVEWKPNYRDDGNGGFFGTSSSPKIVRR